METLFGIRFRELREESCKLQKEVAADLGVAKNTISEWEGQVRTTTFGMCMQIARYFKVTTDYLLGNHDEFGNLLTEEEIDKIIENEKKKRL